MQEPSVLDEAEAKNEFRRLHREIGPVGCLQIVYELMKSAEWMCEVLNEEK